MGLVGWAWSAGANGDRKPCQVARCRPPTSMIKREPTRFRWAQSGGMHFLGWDRRPKKTTSGSRDAKKRDVTTHIDVAILGIFFLAQTANWYRCGAIL